MFYYLRYTVNGIYPTTVKETFTTAAARDEYLNDLLTNYHNIYNVYVFDMDRTTLESTNYRTIETH